MVLRLESLRERVSYTVVLVADAVVDATDARRDVTCRTRTFADLQYTATPSLFTSPRRSVVVCTANSSAWKHLILLSARWCEVDSRYGTYSSTE
jgi:hypothetical protein